MALPAAKGATAADLRLMVASVSSTGCRFAQPDVASATWTRSSKMRDLGATCCRSHRYRSPLFAERVPGMPSAE